MSRHTYRRPLRLATGAALAGVLFLSAACSTDTDDTNNDSKSSSADSGATSNNDDPGKKVVIGFSGPAADHGWLAAINSSAQSVAKGLIIVIAVLLQQRLAARSNSGSP